MKHPLLSFVLGTVAALRIASGASATHIADPEAFVKETYDKFAASGSADYVPPADIYTPRLQALFVRDKKWAKGEVGCLDFDFWVNGQDWKLKNVRINSQAVSGNVDRRTIVAKFVNLGTANEIHFYFKQIGGEWMLDDAQSVLGGNKWMLSKILSCPH
jgi:hypothetical protein